MLVLNFGLLGVNYLRRPCNVEFINMMRDAAFSISFGLLLLSNAMVLFRKEHYFDIHHAMMLGSEVVLVVATIHAFWCVYVFRSSRAAKLTEHWHSAMIDKTHQTSFQLELYYHELIYMRQRILELTPLSLRRSTAQKRGGDYKSSLSSVHKADDHKANTYQESRYPQNEQGIPGTARFSRISRNTEPLLGECSNLNPTQALTFFGFFSERNHQISLNVV
jgi:hypothetical protein